MANEIADRIAFFLKDHPPFSFLSYKKLEELAMVVTVRYAEKDETIFSEGDDGLDRCFVVRQGNVKLTRQENGKLTLVDQCDAGEILGIRSILTGKPYVLTATCEEESLLYEIPKEPFRLLLDSEPKFGLFFASGYAAGQAVVREKGSPPQPYVTALEEQRIVVSSDVLVAAGSISIQQAAQKMKDRRVGSIILVNKQNHPVGIVTDTDLRSKVVAEGLKLETAIEAIMSSPVATIRPVFSYSEVLIQMMRQRVHHLVVTEDGSPDSPVTGIISDHDVLLSQNNNPAALVKALRKSSDSKVWPDIRDNAEQQVSDFIEKDLSVGLISNFITAINDLLIEKAINSALAEVPEAATIPFCWLSLGSEGREEQLLRTDQDNAIIFESQGNFEREQQVLLTVAGKVNQHLLDCGFAECPAEIMARNPKYCQDIKGWEQYFTQWITTPEPKALMNATIFFDFRGVFGNLDLEKELQLFLQNKLDGQKIFLNHLAANAIQNPPPLGFFKQFLVEKGGEHKEEFDIKKRAMMPLSDAARVLALQYGQTGIQNTPMRFQRLASLDAKNKMLYESCAQAYEVLMKIRTKYGLKNHSSGRYIDIESMNKLEKQMLKSAFLPIKEIQQLLEVRFQLAYFR